jgi:hypothetical protein
MFTLPTLRRGDDRSLLIGVSLSGGTLVGSQSVRCTFKRDLGDSDTAAALRLSTADNTIQIVDATHVRLIFGHAATAALDGGRYYVDIQVVTSGGLVETFENLSDTAVVKSDVTQTVP